MSEGERIACITGLVLIGMAVTIMRWDGESGTRRSRRRSKEPPVEELAEELKQAWGEFHTP